MGMLDLIESRIQDAMAAGEFDNLAGQGKPLRLHQDGPGGADALGYKILNNGGHLPDWLLLAKEIEQAQAELRKLEERHQWWVDATASSGAWERNWPILVRTRSAIEQQARALRKKQDRFNFDAPMIALERPAVWVERVLARLDEALREAGAPEALLAASS
ncbi:MAG: DUF1992 domain-containing protein [Dehalococcoidia bacterium]